MSISLNEFLQKKAGRYPLGIWIAVVALLLSFVGWLMQAYSLLDWESAKNLGLQNGSFSGNAVDRALAHKEHGEALVLADVGVRAREKEYVVRDVRAAREHLLPVDHPVFAVALGARLRRRDVRAGGGLRVAEAAQGLTGCEAREHLGESRVLQGAAVVREHAVELVFGVVEDRVDGLHRVGGEADGPDLALLLELEDGWDGFLPDLRERDIFDIVDQKNVEVIGAEPLE